MTEKTAVVAHLVALHPMVTAARWNAVPAMARTFDTKPVACAAFTQTGTRSPADAAAEYVVAHQLRRTDPPVGAPRDTRLEAANGEGQRDGHQRSPMQHQPRRDRTLDAPRVPSRSLVATDGRTDSTTISGADVGLEIRVACPVTAVGRGRIARRCWWAGWCANAPAVRILATDEVVAVAV